MKALAEIVGAQVAWWQLGFRGRRAALRQEASPDVMAVAHEWSRQVLAAPWWWRLTRVLMNGAVAVLGCAAVLVVALDGTDERVMVNYALLSALPAVPASAWWQTRCARKLAVRGGPHPPRRSRVWLAAQAIALVVALGVLGGMVAESAAVDVRSRLRCPAFAVDPEVRELAMANGHCPLADTAADVTGYPHTSVGNGNLVWEDVYRIPGLGVVTMPHELARAWQADLTTLGPPVDYLRPDGELWFLNFHGGYLVAGPITPTGVHLRRIVLGERYEPVSRVGDCPTIDRPCVVSVERTADTVTVVWSYPDADAFNVQWWEERSPPIKGVEVAARRFTLRGTDPARMYGFTIEACAKRFLGRSTCTPWSPTIIVPASL